MPTLGLIHTGLVFVAVEPVFRELCTELLPGVRTIDLVDGALLADTLAAGTITDPIAARFAHLVRCAELAGCDVVLSLCSSLGPAADRSGARIPLLKVDAPMAAAAARCASVAVLATVPSTLPPSCALIAAQPGCRSGIRSQLVEGAFAALMAGDRDCHDALVEAAAMAVAPQVEALVLAQASMARLAGRLEQACGRPVLSSPRSGVLAAARQLGVLP